MAVRFLAYEVADLCLGKPPLRSLSASATVADALAAVKSSDENCISVWSCDHKRINRECVCVGKVCMVDIICYLCREENLGSPALALKAPVSVLLSKVKGLVRHVDPSSSLLEAIDLILQGAQNLVVPIKSNSRRKTTPKSIIIALNHSHISQRPRILLANSRRCDQIPPQLNRPILPCPNPLHRHPRHHHPQIHGRRLRFPSLIGNPRHFPLPPGSNFGGGGRRTRRFDRGDLPSTLASCDETVAAAIMTLSTGELLAYIDCGGPPEEIIRVVEERLKEKNLESVLEELVNNSGNSSSSDEELPSPTTPLSRPGWYSRSSSYSSRMVRRAEAIVCHPWSSLVAVMIQAIAHRANYVWVIEDDSTVVGIVTFANMLEVFRENLESMI
ncbi:UNVERIFIED_CONTAM: CBS domain-containing protein CBSX5 [Sesamum angustifolium]|uniref:CBS domain-containing protein CBSX5 n=1 Tax=Sesamum angustifolium TaxID=2727405 RepID=A0AAW2PFI3_9LAMI